MSLQTERSGLTFTKGASFQIEKSGWTFSSGLSSKTEKSGQTISKGVYVKAEKSGWTFTNGVFFAKSAFFLTERLLQLQKINRQQSCLSRTSFRAFLPKYWVSKDLVTRKQRLAEV